MSRCNLTQLTRVCASIYHHSMDSIDTVAAMIGRHVHKSGGGRPTSVRAGIGPRYRPQFVEAAAYAIDQQWVALQDGELRPGVVVPPVAQVGHLGDLAAQIQAATTSAHRR